MRFTYYAGMGALTLAAAGAAEAGAMAGSAAMAEFAAVGAGANVAAALQPWRAAQTGAAASASARAMPLLATMLPQAIPGPVRIALPEWRAAPEPVPDASFVPFAMQAPPIAPPGPLGAMRGAPAPVAAPSVPMAAPEAGALAVAGGFGAPLAADQLDVLRGGSDTVYNVSNDARLSAVVSGNSATYVSTGANTIDGAAFANASGIPIVIQNTGANVSIQNATIVNLQLR